MLFNKLIHCIWISKPEGQILTVTIYNFFGLFLGLYFFVQAPFWHIQTKKRKRDACIFRN